MFKRNCETHGHRYEARYDFSEPSEMSFKGASTNDIAKLMEASKRKTYVKDVCVRCGKEIKR